MPDLPVCVCVTITYWGECITFTVKSANIWGEGLGIDNVTTLLLMQIGKLPSASRNYPSRYNRSNCKGTSKLKNSTNYYSSITLRHSANHVGNRMHYQHRRYHYLRELRIFESFHFRSLARWMKAGYFPGQQRSGRLLHRESFPLINSNSSLCNTYQWL